MSAEPQPYLYYLDCRGVAETIGVKVETVWVYLARGSMPEPDMVWMRHPLWLPETISEWRKLKWKHRKGGRPKRRQKIRQPDAVRTRRPPKVKAAPPSKGGALPKPRTSTVAPEVARQIAAALRTDGVHCTTDDVIALANYQGELDHERDKLRQRVVARLRALEHRER